MNKEYPFYIGILEKTKAGYRIPKAKGKISPFMVDDEFLKDKDCPCGIVLNHVLETFKHRIKTSDWYVPKD